MKFTRATRIYDDRKKERVSVAIEIEIDFDELAFHLARKAAHNKSGVSKIQSGIIKGVILK